MDNLFSDDPRIREAEAGKYKVFAENITLPAQHANEWQRLLGSKTVDQGDPWPHHLTEIAKPDTWPEFSFGTANAACVLVWHRPGRPGQRGLYIEPNLPVLGGIPHAHNAFWYPRYHASPSWRLLHKYLPLAFKGLKNPWSQLMTACINAEPGATGSVDTKANKDAVNNGVLDRVVALCQPRIILLCGTPVHKATARWDAPSRTEVLRVSHPSTWDGYGGHGSQGPEIVSRLQDILF